MHPDFAVRTLMKRIRQRKDKPKLDMGLHEFVHPSLRESTDRLEYCTIKFALATEQFLGREGKNVTHPSNQYNVKRMADIAIDIYAMTAVLGRASRSYCIGVRNCDQEMLIANLFVHEAWERVRSNFNNVSMYKNHVDISLQKIADAMFENNGYTPQHPLTRTFW
ncbi:UNVERIFIED_CONTAM: hypothetical protein GTU68_037315 [Idotea baltica]|nr:hypothetical protein [Idotea baltica]